LERSRCGRRKPCADRGPDPRAEGVVEQAGVRAVLTDREERLVNQALLAVREDGTYARLFDNYFG
jgi:ABC-type amino acid transport substrate-binding protein